MLHVPGPDSLDAALSARLLKGPPSSGSLNLRDASSPWADAKLDVRQNLARLASSLRRGCADSGWPGCQGDTAVVSGPSPAQPPEYAAPETTRKGL